MPIGRWLPPSLCLWLLFASPAFSAPVEQQDKCEVRIDGQRVTFLRLVSKDGKKPAWSKPGEVIHVPPGEYAVDEVKVEGGFEYDLGWLRKEDFFRVAADRPTSVKVGAPLLPSVEVERQGMYLNFDYELTDRAGRVYQRPSGRETPPPSFAVYRGDERIGHGNFEYG